MLAAQLVESQKAIMEPAAYPAKNTEEISAILVFLSLLDVERVKPDVKFLDKVPNLDGSVELVDEKQRPVGELKIQVKKIPDNSTQFDCPIELVAYSNRVSSPFILVCVDVGNRKAYWCHISSVMPGVKPEQKTFTVRFLHVVDEIGIGYPYFERWIALCRDYLERVSHFPKLKRKVDDEIGLNKLPINERVIFQQFIEEVNLLLDVDIPIVKHEYFAGIWKLGVRVHKFSVDAVSYSIYSIPNGENAPLVIHQPEMEIRPRIENAKGTQIQGLVSFRLDTGCENNISTQWLSRDYFSNPVLAAREFVLRYLVRLFREKRIHVHGRNQSAELLMSFTRDYAHTLGLQESDTYKTADIAYGINVFLPVWYSLAYPRTMEFFREHYSEMLRHNPNPSFEQIANSARRRIQHTEGEVRKAIETKLRPSSFPVRTYDFTFSALYQAIDYLLANDVNEIVRVSRPWSLQGKFVWNCYTLEDLKHNIETMLLGAAEDYPEFVKGNRFGRLDSQLLSREVAMICVVESKAWQDSKNEPAATTFLVENADRSLPLLTFVDLSIESEAWVVEGGVSMFRGVRRQCTRTGLVSLSHYADRCKTREMLYDWLRNDLERRFGRLPN